MRLDHMLSLMLALALPGVAAAQVAVTAAPIDEVVATIMPIDQLVAQAIAASREGFRARTSGDANLLALEKRKPGLMAAIDQSLATSVKGQASTLSKSLRERVRGVLVARLNEEELISIRDFYRTPTGQRMITRVQSAAVAQGVERSKSIAAQALAEKRAPVIGKPDVQAMTNAAAAEAIKGIEADDIPVLQRFGASSAAPKLAAIGSELTALASEEVNAWMGRAIPVIQVAIRGAIDRHMQGKR